MLSKILENVCQKGMQKIERVYLIHNGSASVHMKLPFENWLQLVADGFGSFL